MASVEIDLRDDDEAEVSILGGMGGDSWQIGDVLILVGDRISEAIAKELVFHWLSVKGLREGMNSEQFWLWLGQAAEEKIEREKEQKSNGNDCV